VPLDPAYKAHLAGHDPVKRIWMQLIVFFHTAADLSFEEDSGRAPTGRP
jgi:hypothetical protein